MLTYSWSVWCLNIVKVAICSATNQSFFRFISLFISDTRTVIYIGLPDIIYPIKLQGYEEIEIFQYDDSLPVLSFIQWH